MKKFLLSVATVVAASAAFSADQFYVIMKDGSVESYPTDKVDSLSFDDPQIAKIMGFNDMVAEIVKLKERIEALEAKSGISDTLASDLRYFVLNDKEVEVIGIINGAANIVVPEKTYVNGKLYTVTGIGWEAFKAELIQTVVLPNTIKNIGSNAFSESPLTCITIPDGVSSIDAAAFCNCRYLTSVTIPESVTSIESSAFLHCCSLTSLTIPESVTEIGEDAFNDCYNLDVVIDNVSANVTYSTSCFKGCKSVKFKDSELDLVDLGYKSEISVSSDDYNYITIMVFNPVKSFAFTVLSTSGSSWEKNRVVTIKIEGYDGEFTLSDAENSWLLWTGSGFVTANNATAKQNTQKVVAGLSCVDSQNDYTFDYTFISPTLNETMKHLGVQETLFYRAWGYISPK